MELKDIFERKLNQLGIKRQVTASQVCDAYNKAVLEIFGADALKNTEAISFKKGILKVRVSSSSWAQEVQGRSGEILENINKKNGGVDVKKIIFN
ncbi:hypothetical protein COY62_00760 [bacterium (Candidatus Howlettbacteria) CG_4_10_14_0_8_um_filter_40_9]|nr:MAG: hypothetical protein COY62_00760 [bacterium (Candidatus Howlettbacteria) CG_4_10_14_0_8_um_filter_40_9]